MVRGASPRIVLNGQVEGGIVPMNSSQWSGKGPLRTILRGYGIVEVLAISYFIVKRLIYYDWMTEADRSPGNLVYTLPDRGNGMGMVGKLCGDPVLRG